MGIIEEKNNIYDYGENQGVLKDEIEAILNGKDINNIESNYISISYNNYMITLNGIIKIENDGTLIRNIDNELQIEILHLLKEDLNKGLVVLTEEQLSLVNELDIKFNSDLEEDKQRIL